MSTLTSQNRLGSNAYDAMVTARVPRGIKDQGDAILRELGESPTRLINAAYNYVICHKQLPQNAHTQSAKTAGKRKLSKQQLANLQSSIARSTVSVNLGNKSYKELRNEALQEKYPEHI